MIKISLSGKANSGKSTVGKIFSKSLRARKLTCVSDAFATPIKKFLKEIYPQIPYKFLNGASKYRKEIVPGIGRNISIRDLIIETGDLIRKQYGDDIFIKTIDYKINHNMKNKCDAFIITDARFKEEFSYLNNKNFFKIRIKRPNIDLVNHSTELSQDQYDDSYFDYIINNNSSVDNLDREINKIVSNIIS